MSRRGGLVPEGSMLGAGDKRRWISGRRRSGYLVARVVLVFSAHPSQPIPALT